MRIYNPAWYDMNCPVVRVKEQIITLQNLKPDTGEACNILHIYNMACGSCAPLIFILEDLRISSLDHG